MTESGRQGAPLPFPIGFLRKEQVVAIERAGERGHGHAIAGEKLGAFDQHLFDQKGIGQQDRFSDEGPESRQSHQSFPIGRRRPVLEKVSNIGLKGWEGARLERVKSAS